MISTSLGPSVHKHLGVSLLAPHPPPPSSNLGIYFQKSVWGWTGLHGVFCVASCFIHPTVALAASLPPAALGSIVRSKRAHGEYWALAMVSAISTVSLPPILPSRAPEELG